MRIHKTHIALPMNHHRFQLKLLTSRWFPSTKLLRDSSSLSQCLESLKSWRRNRLSISWNLIQIRHRGGQDLNDHLAGDHHDTRKEANSPRIRHEALSTSLKTWTQTLRCWMAKQLQWLILMESLLRCWQLMLSLRFQHVPRLPSSEKSTLQSTSLRANKIRCQGIEKCLRNQIRTLGEEIRT